MVNLNGYDLEGNLILEEGGAYYRLPISNAEIYLKSLDLGDMKPYHAAYIGMLVQHSKAEGPQG